MQTNNQSTEGKDPQKTKGESSLDGAACARLITQAELENALTHEGIVGYDAIEDPFGYDNGETELAVSIAARVLDETARQKTAHLIEALEAADECLALIEDVGHGSMMDNVTVARRIVQSAISSANAIAVAPPESAAPTILKPQ
jgi:hypothetical protein